MKTDPDFKHIADPEGNTRSLLERFKAGDDTAFEQIYKQWFSPIYNLLKQLTGSEEDARDITQDVFGRLWERRGTIEVDKGVKSYLFSAARHSAINLFDKNRAADNYLSDAGHADDESASSFEFVAAREIELLTEYVIGTMPRQRRQVYELSYKEGMSPAEIAAKLELSPRAVHDHLYQARISIREILPVAIIMTLLLIQNTNSDYLAINID